MKSAWLAAIALSLAIIPAQAQLHGGPGGGISTLGNVHIHVTLNNDRDAGPYLLVRLMHGSSDDVVGTTYTNDRGEADFGAVPIGDYHVEVSGNDIETTNSDTFEVDSRKISQSQYVTVRRVEGAGPEVISAHSAAVSAADLKVSDKARKELDKANEAMALHDWKKAKEHFDKALAIEPNYVTAYSNLAVLYAKLDDVPNEEQALKKAVSLDGHFGPALLNYAKLSIRQKNYPQAESLLEKEVAVDPNNPESLLLLADAQYMDRHFEAAIASALKAHTASKDHPTFVHYIAARAYQQQNRQQDALTQFQQFLKEEPKGPRADFVRNSIKKMQSDTQAAAHSPTAGQSAATQ